MVTLVVCPRLFAFLTTFTSGAPRRNHMCQQNLRPSQKNTQRHGRLVVHVRSAICHELCKTQPGLKGKRVSVGVDEWSVVWWKKKRDVTAVTVPKKKTISAIADKLPRKECLSITVLKLMQKQFV